MLTDQQLESLLASRPERTITKASIESRIKMHGFMHPPHGNGSTLTVCVITMENGFEVTGESACAHPENFNQEIGDKIAYDNAFKKLWALEGYLLKEALHREKLAAEKSA